MNWLKGRGFGRWRYKRWRLHENWVDLGLDDQQEEILDDMRKAEESGLEYAARMHRMKLKSGIGM